MIMITPDGTPIWQTDLKTQSKNTMNFETHFLQLVEKNPLLVGTAKIETTPAKMKAMLQAAYEAGKRDGKAETPLFNRVFGKDRFNSKP